jgi:hypothetical protein
VQAVVTAVALAAVAAVVFAAVAAVVGSLGGGGGALLVVIWVVAQRAKLKIPAQRAKWASITFQIKKPF